MAQNSKIEWTDHTWPIVSGCDYESAGCANCYAVRDAWRMGHNPNLKISGVYAGAVDKRHGRLRWTGQVKCLPQRLDWPLRWKKSAKIFVCNQSDLFHPAVPFDFIDQVFWVMRQAEWHIFQILTKRPGRLVEYIRDRRRELPYLPNVWFGVSVEDQAAANKRIPDLLKVPAAVRFLSCEPLLGPVDLGQACPCGYYCDQAVGHVDHPFWTPGLNTGIHWVIVGGESGSNARPMHPDWTRSIRDQCQAAGVAYFFKQWGEWYPLSQREDTGVGPLIGSYAHTPNHWTMTNGEKFERAGKKAAGNLLDGREWKEMPQRNDTDGVAK